MEEVHVMLIEKITTLNTGDIRNEKTVEKLDRFIETYQNKKADVADMVRITSYTTEGDAIWQ